MRAHLRQVRISPKKANLVASLVRGMTVAEALSTLENLPKKGAIFLHGLISSAVANAENTAKQSADGLFVKTLIVNKGPAFKRSTPMARGRSRPIDKWTSHITVELGVVVPDGEESGSERSTKKIVGAESFSAHSGDLSTVASEGAKVGAGERKTKKKDKKKKEPKGEYSEKKPATSFIAKGAKIEDDIDSVSNKKTEGGSATFQTQRKGSRGT